MQLVSSVFPEAAWSNLSWPRIAVARPARLAKVPVVWDRAPDDAVDSTLPDDPAANVAHDVILARRAIDGDQAAMARIVEQHQDAVTRLLWRFARNRADLEDLVQDTFLRVVRNLSNWEGRQPLAHWVQRIATNVGRDYFRRHAVRRRWMVEPRADAADEGAPPEAVSADADPAARAAANEVKELLAQLEPDECTVLTLHYLEGWDMARIGEQCGWTVTATRVRAWRARRQLRKLLESPERS